MEKLTGNQTLSLLRSVPFFADLSMEQLAMVAAHRVERRLEAGQMAFLEGEPSAGLYLLVKGRAKVSRLSLDGREQVLSVLKPGNSCNKVPVIDGGPNPASLTAAQSATVWIWTHEEINRLRREIPPLNEAIIQSLAHHCRALVETVYRLSFLTVTERLARFLVEHVSRDSQLGLDRQRWTQQEIAAHIGTVREMVSRSLRNLEKQGYIRFNRHRIEIIKPEELEQLY